MYSFVCLWIQLHHKYTEKGDFVVFLWYVCVAFTAVYEKQKNTAKINERFKPV